MPAAIIPIKLAAMIQRNPLCTIACKLNAWTTPIPKLPNARVRILKSFARGALVFSFAGEATNTYMSTKERAPQLSAQIHCSGVANDHLTADQVSP